MRKFENYISNLRILQNAKYEDLSNDFIISGIIDKFYIQFELGWKVLKALLKFEGRAEAQSGSPREIIKTAFAVYDFIDDEIWLDMLRERNNTAHIYDSEAARELVGHILEIYIPEFIKIRDQILIKYAEKLNDII